MVSLILISCLFSIQIVLSFTFLNLGSPISRLQNKRIQMSNSKNIEFVKYQGLGNDFILVDNTKSHDPIFTPEESVHLCDRNFGIGADGVIFVMKGQNDCDYKMRIYNSDGSEPQMCGNGIRCMAKFISQIIHKQQNTADITYKIWTNAGVISPTVASNGLVIVDMGEPILNAAKVPTLLKDTRDGMAIDSQFTALGSTFHATTVSMGNPHCIIYVDDFNMMNPEFSRIGPVIENLDIFPQRINVEFVKVLNRNHVEVKVWERGAGPTLACGTGACAVVVAGVLNDKNDRKCTVTLPGGDLEILWHEENNKIYMTGPAEKVFSGII